MTPETTETFAEQGIPINPFPGLRPFDFDESHLFFGRDGQSEQLISKLGSTHFLAVVGTSGSGKSSLVRAGLMPSLLGGFMTSAGSNWRIVVMRPGNDPIGNLARALNSKDVFGSEIKENAELQTILAEATLQRGSRGLVDAVRQAVIADNENLLVVVDQFEEIFRFARVAEDKEYSNEAAAFVKLLLEASRQREIPIYIVLTMRSDYLGDCSQFWGLPEAINESQYLIPRLTRDQLKEAITGPIGVARGLITPRLIARLLNDVGDDQDQLPVLQHLLMRVWDEGNEKQLEIEVTQEGKVNRSPHRQIHKGEALDLCCYDAVGGMAQALSRHADEALEELPDQRSRVVAEKLFKALTEKGADNREIRRPVTLGEICAITGASASEVITVIESFRRSGRSFLMTPGDQLSADSLIDISHESLIRAWSRLKDWVEEEARSARIYRRLADTAVLEAEGGAGLWRDPDLQIALTWRDQTKPNKVWAQRYHREFEMAMKFLDRSVDARDLEIREREKEIRRGKSMKQLRWTAVVFALLFLLSMAALVVANQQRRRANFESAIANEQREIANNLLAKVSQSEKEARHAEEQAQLARDNAEQQRKAAVEFARQAEALRKVASEAQKKALKQKDLAEQQASRVAELERKARKDADEEREINSLTRELKDQLAGKEKTEVLNIASKLSNYYKDKRDPRGEYETQTILGSAYLELKKSTEATEAAIRALKIQQENQIDNEKNRHENLTVLRDAYSQQADSEDVTGFTRSSQENERRGRLKTDLLLAAFKNGSEALTVQEKLIGAESPGLIPDLASLALVSEKRVELASAEGYRQRIVEVQKKALLQNSAELVTYLSELASFNQSQGDYSKAEDRLKAALSIQERTLDPKDPQLIATLNSLASVYRAEKKDADADRIVQRVQQLQGSSALLRKGASGPEVKKLQLQLQKLGLFHGTVDEYFGEATEAAVIQFQTGQGLQADGVVGPATVDRLQQPQVPEIGAMDIQTKLQTLGFYSGAVDGVFGMRSKAALMSFQRSKGLDADGSLNPATLEALGFAVSTKSPSITGKVTVEIVAKMFPNIPVDNIKTNLPFVLRALEDLGLSDKEMVLMALTVIGIDTGTFGPVTERKSRFNTSAEGYPFDLYDNRKELGNQGPPDGERFKGRGYIELTGRARYARYGGKIGLGNQLVENPDLANQPDIAAKIFAKYLKEFEQVLRPALEAGDLTKASRTWYGRPILADQFTKAFQTGASLIQ